MRVLVYRESSGLVKQAFLDRGCDAWSCDMVPSDVSENHIIGNIFSVIRSYHWDLLIAFPICTYLTLTGNKWMKPEFRDRFPHRIEQRETAIKLFMRLTRARIERICIENPVGIMSRIWRRPDQYVHPYYFGEPHSKKTGLWLKSLPKLIPTNMVEPQFYTFKDGRRCPLWHIQTIKLPAELRNRARASIAIKGMAEAMANQWG